MSSSSEAPTHCPRCRAAVKEPQRYCESCGELLRPGLVTGDLVRKLRIARGWILATGVLYAVSPLAMVAISQVPWSHPAVKILLATNFSLAGAHVGLWFWARQAPFAAAVVALVLFVSVHLVNGILDPRTWSQGLLVKLLFLVVLGQAIHAGLQARRIREETEHHSA